ncbi:globin [Trichinella nativa]|uniref:Globin n=1 Tax=Trichinella nativa TaxID=6335 RepID=A0A1Y3EBF1_9BILA|nr:globin [Trichinella nativa]
MGSCFTTCNQPSRGSPNLSIEQNHPQYFSKMKVETLKQNRFAPKENLRFSLSAGELKLLRWLWKQMKQVHQGLASAKLFQIIFATCPEIKRFFGLAKDTIDMIINSLSYDNEQLAQLMIAFGCQHSFYTRRNFDPKYWNVFGDAMLHLVDDLPLKAFKRYRAKSIWFRFVYFVISHMQLGYTSTKRKRICRRNVKDNKDYR